MSSKKTNKITEQQFKKALIGYVNNDAKALQLATKRDEKVKKIDDEYNPQFDAMRKEMDEQFAIVQEYCEQNREKEFGDKATIELHGAKLQFRMGTPKLTPLNGFEWEEIKLMVSKKLPDYVRTSIEISKDKLMADKDNPRVARNLEKVGLKIERQETFKINIPKTAL